jgi:hypothetical protein
VEIPSSLFSSYELGLVREHLAAEARVRPTNRWQIGYRAAALHGFLATPNRKDGAWGDPVWVAKYSTARQFVVEAHEAGEQQTIGEAVAALQQLLDRVTTIEQAF